MNRIQIGKLKNLKTPKNENPQKLSEEIDHNIQINMQYKYLKHKYVLQILNSIFVLI